MIQTEAGSGNRSSYDAAAGPPDVSIMIVAYNSEKLIEACIGGIPAACTRYSYEILCIDNASGGTEELVSEKFPMVRVVPSRGNIGFAAANNLLAEASRGQLLLLLNPDLELKPGALDALLAAAERYPDSAAFGGVTVDREGMPDKGNNVHAPSLLAMASRIFGRSIAGQRNAGIEADEKVEVLSGSFVLISRDAWEEVGGFDDRYFLYCEEVDLFYRLATRQHTIWRISDAIGIHDIGHGEKDSPTRELYLTAGTMQFARIHWNKPRQWAAFALLWIGSCQRYLAGLLFGKWSDSAEGLRRKHRLIALRPNLWRHGYDETRGLRARLDAGSVEGCEASADRD